MKHYKFLSHLPRLADLLGKILKDPRELGLWQEFVVAGAEAFRPFVREIPDETALREVTERVFERGTQ